jgi:manganese peroxidase
VGRSDSCTPAPANKIPDPNISGDDALLDFQAHGFTAEDLAALIGAHTVSNQTVAFPSEAGVPQDSTADLWDNLYYNETLAHNAPFSFPSDINLINQTLVGPFFANFGKNRTGWDSSFSNA